MARSPTARGPAWFGPAYAEMMRHDPHARGSIDRRLLVGAIGLDARSARRLYDRRSRPTPGYRRGSRPQLETIVGPMVGPEPDRTVAAIARFASSLSRRGPRGIDRLRFGGSEEAIVDRGSDWCSDVARVTAALAQVAGIPSRIVLLADTSLPYAGHAVIEAYRDHRWGCVDGLTGVVYRRPSGEPATTWELMRHPSWVRSFRDPSATPYSNPGQFRRCAIAPYRLPLRTARGYRSSRINAYYRAVLRQSERGWPGGRRWLFGEGDRPAPGVAVR